ncbi:hypothetical protein D2T29_16695 [Sinirhodobacter populi]|uniref:Uncharacterized protein n=1 Tax=Paenirhodobacter populi TaxID=2306993 RepID=A0A443K732_9RHOB|nr:hypothetical protein [Sinirhodobacter populi]RWR28546.1 hypothetical protein D2T29_16695 [Sinirhodobacter populi]
MIVPCDTDFAHAVRLAATGLRTASGIDPEIEGAPLAAILCSDRALDPDALELLARLVTGNLRKVIPPAGESIMAHAVRRAGTAWRKGKDADPTTTGAPLAAILRGDPARLGPGERALLADMVTGELRRGQSAPTKGAGHPDVLAVVEAVNKRLNEGDKLEFASEFVAAQFEIDKRTVFNYLKIAREREAMIGKATDIKSEDK